MIGAIISFNPFLLLFLPAAFLLGSIPFGIVYTRSRGIDIRKVGSGNIGATNVLRAAGKGTALLTLASDMLKGLVPVVLCMNAIPEAGGGLPYSVADIYPGIVGLAAVAGHMFSVFLLFRGGKGVATAFGILSVFSPLQAGITFAAWILSAYMFKYVSLAAIISFSLLPVFYLITGASGARALLAAALAFLIIYKHRSNIRNIIDGKEPRIGEKKRAEHEGE